MNTQDWNGCYDGSWQSAPLVAEAYAHPAKVSFNLAERIYRHMLAEGWLQPGDLVLDPFGGIGGFAFHAALYGMHWTGVELEQRFVDLGQQNLELWRNRYAPHFPGYGTARLLQGDSRRLVDVVTGAGGVVSSPLFEGSLNDGLKESDRQKYTEFARAGRSMGNTYGTTPGQLGAMPAGVVSSPPFGTGDSASAQSIEDRTDKSAQWIRDNTRQSTGYGSTPGNLGNMPAGVVSSPPFENANQSTDAEFLQLRAEQHRNGSRMQPGPGTYGDSPNNIGNNTGDTFWSAAALIVQQCYAILPPGGYAAWVTGDFVRAKRRVPFGQQWLNLCVSCGFEPVLWAVAWKTEHNGTQAGMFGDARELRKEKVSFFRRLANQKNPNAAIANEDVLFVRKPKP